MDDPTLQKVCERLAEEVGLELACPGRSRDSAGRLLGADALEVEVVPGSTGRIRVTSSIASRFRTARSRVGPTVQRQSLECSKGS